MDRFRGRFLGNGAGGSISSCLGRARNILLRQLPHNSILPVSQYLHHGWYCELSQHIRNASLTSTLPALLLCQVICDAFEVLSSPHRVEIELGAETYAHLWRFYDEEGLGTIKIRSTEDTKDLYHLLGRLEAPLGVGEMDRKKIDARIMQVIQELHCAAGVEELHFTETLDALAKVALSKHTDPALFAKRSAEAAARAVIKRKLASMRSTKKLDPEKAKIRAQLRALDEKEELQRQQEGLFGNLFCYQNDSGDGLDERSTLELALALRELENQEESKSMDHFERARRIFHTASKVAKRAEERGMNVSPTFKTRVFKESPGSDDDDGQSRGVDAGGCWGDKSKAENAKKGNQPTSLSLPPQTPPPK